MQLLLFVGTFNSCLFPPSHHLYSPQCMKSSSYWYCIMTKLMKFPFFPVRLFLFPFMEEFGNNKETNSRTFLETTVKVKWGMTAYEQSVVRRWYPSHRLNTSKMEGFLLKWHWRVPVGLATTAFSISTFLLYEFSLHHRGSPSQYIFNYMSGRIFLDVLLHYDPNDSTIIVLPLSHPLSYWSTPNINGNAIYLQTSFIPT